MFIAGFMSPKCIADYWNPLLFFFSFVSVSLFFSSSGKNSCARRRLMLLLGFRAGGRSKTGERV